MNVHFLHSGWIGLTPRANQTRVGLEVNWDPWWRSTEVHLFSSHQGLDESLHQGTWTVPLDRCTVLDLFESYCVGCEDTLRFQWRCTYVDILGNVLCRSVGLLENHQHTWRFALQVCWTERWFCWSWLSHFFAISYPFRFVSSHRLGILPPMWTWWLSGAVFKSADVVSTHQTVTETFVSWGLWAGIGITGEVWEAVVVVATSQLWWLWQLISGADGSFEILLWLNILECLLYFI